MNLEDEVGLFKRATVESSSAPHEVNNDGSLDSSFNPGSGVLIEEICRSLFGVKKMTTCFLI
jgi:hypothetical protein